MSKGSKAKNTPATSNKTPSRGNSLDNYFPADTETGKKRKMSSLDLSGNNGSPPAKKENKEDPENKGKESTPSSERVCKHLDTQLSDMEKRLETSLTASLSASITASVTAGLKDLIDSSLKEALETMSNKVNEVIDDHLTIIHHGEKIDSLETENPAVEIKDE